MECREPLLIPDPSTTQTLLAYRPPGGGPLPSDWARGRATQNRAGPPNRSNTNAPVPPPAKKRLPLPKNVVLMSLMDATDIASAPQPTQPTDSSSPTSRIAENTAEDDQEYEEQKIRLSTWLARSGCGTYVITDKEGSHVYPSKPTEDEDSARGSENEDVDAMVRFFYLENKMPVLGRGLEDASVGELPPVKLSKGDRIQIVSIDDGWAKLARGYGYVRAGRGQLAKGKFHSTQRTRR
jgi:hypothetical protein